MDGTCACWRPGSPSVSGVDAPEIGKAKCKGEEFLGTQAKRRLQELLSLIVRIEEPGVKVLRVRSRVNAPTPAGEVLVREGFAGVWGPGKGIDWWQVRGKENERLSLICEAEIGKRWEDAPDKNSRSAGDRR